LFKYKSAKFDGKSGGNLLSETELVLVYFFVQQRPLQGTKMNPKAFAGATTLLVTVSIDALNLLY